MLQIATIPIRWKSLDQKPCRKQSKKDHVCAFYKDIRRSNDNFITSDVINMNIDNDHTDDPSEYITEAKMDELFLGINYCLVPSRHHMLEKGTHPAAPRYHVMLLVEVITDAIQYVKMKVKEAFL